MRPSGSDPTEKGRTASTKAFRKKVATSEPLESVTTAEKLKVARALLASPDAWTNGVHARDAAGRAVDYDSPSAVSFSLRGALRRAGGPTFDLELGRELNQRFTRFNEHPHTRHDDIIALLDDLILTVQDPHLLDAG